MPRQETNDPARAFELYGSDEDVQEVIIAIIALEAMRDSQTRDVDDRAMQQNLERLKELLLEKGVVFEKDEDLDTFIRYFRRATSY